MAHLPDISYGSDYRQIRQGQFGGLKHCRDCHDGEIYDMDNVTLDEFPIIKTRDRRKRFSQIEDRNIRAIYADNGMMLAVTGNEIIKDNSESLYIGLSTGSDTQLVRFGDRVVVLPDKLLLNTKYPILGVIDEISQLPEQGQKFGDCFALKAREQPGNRKLYVWDGTSWQDNGFFAMPMDYGYTWRNVIIQDSTNLWDVFETHGTADTISITVTPDELFGFKEGDAVQISGCTEEQRNNKIAIIREIKQTGEWVHFRFSENCFYIPQEDPQYEVPQYQENDVTIEKKSPEMDFMFECNNRMWGAKGKTIYASKLGDPTNWYFFDGLSIDSWSVDTQSKGNILGGWGDYYPYFLREDGMTVVCGTVPSGYQAYNRNAVPGIMPGEERSIVQAGAYTLWLSRDGMIVYASDNFQILKDTFRDWKLSNVIGVSAGSKAYFAVTDDIWQEGFLLCFDSRTGLWSKESGAYSDLTYDRGSVYGLWLTEEDASIEIVHEEIESEEEYAEQCFGSSVVFGDVYCDTENRKAADLLLMRLEMAPNASLNVYVRYDGGTYERIEMIEAGESGMKKKTIDIPITPHRCDHYNFMLIGDGKWTLYAMTASVRSGSERQ